MTENAVTVSLAKEVLTLCKRRSVRRSLAVAVMVAVYVALLGVYTVQIVLEMRTRTGTHAELFYAGEDQSYSGDRRIPFKAASDGEWRTYRVRIPNVQEIARLRIDPSPGSGAIAIRSVTIRTRNGAVSLEGATLRRAVASTNRLRPEPDDGRGPLRFVSQGEDPFVDLTLPAAAKSLSVPGGAIARKAMGWGIVGGVVWLAVELAGTIILSFLHRRAGLQTWLRKVATILSDNGVLIVTPKLLAVLTALATALVLYIALDLHQSSIGVWEELYPAHPVRQTIDLGHAKWIRGDEWNVHTPWLFSQVHRGAPLVNANIGGERAPLLATVPTNHPAAIMQLKFFGFRLFDLETGFSWFWAYKSFALFLSVFWLLLILTQGELAISAFGAAFFYSSTYIQWWFSSGFTDIISASVFATIGALYLLLAQRRPMMAFGGFLVSYGITNLALHLYPPLLVCMAYLGIAVIAGALLEPGRAKLVRTDFRWRVGAALVSAAALGLLLGDLVADGWSTIVAMRNTSYPGQRLVGSGGVPLDSSLTGFFDSHRYSEAMFPFAPIGNACESSRFVLLAPFLAMTLPLKAYVTRARALLLSLSVYFLITVAWTSTHLPQAIEHAMQRAGWSVAPAGRVVAGMGLASTLFVSVFFAHVRRGAIVPSVHVRILAPLLVAAILFWAGHHLHSQDPIFFSWKTILAGTLAASAIAAGALSGRLAPAVLGLGLTGLPAMTANPLVSGISALAEKPVLLEAARIGGGARDKWVVFGDALLAQGLKAHGLSVVNGVQYVPNKETNERLDPTSAYASIWNRYAHVSLASAPDRVTPHFESIQDDAYRIWLDVCGPHLRTLRVTHVAYTVDPLPADLGCLEELKNSAAGGVRFFRLKIPAEN